MSNSPILQVLIGLFLIFFVFSTLCSGLTELVNRWLKVRADFLLQGIRKLLDGAGAQQRHELTSSSGARPAAGAAAPEAGASAPTGSAQDEAPTGSLADALLRLPIVGTLGQEDDGDPVDKKSMPSYLPARTFAAGIMDLLIPDATGQTSFAEVVARIERLPEPARSSLLSLAKTTDGSIAGFRLAVARWYDDQMDRVSGWYKRHIRRFVIAFAVLSAILFNINVVLLARTLYTDPSAREALVTQSQALQQCPADQREQCAKAATDTVVALGKSSLPLFWQPTNTACVVRDGDTDPGNDCGFLEAHDMDGFGGLALTLLGWAIAAAAFSMGGPFWFDLLGKVASLRGAGNPPPRAPDAVAPIPTTQGQPANQP